MTGPGVVRAAALVRGEGGAPLLLGAPAIRYVGPSGPGGAPAAGAGWSADGADAWTYDDGLLRLRAAVECRADRGTLDAPAAEWRALVLGATALRPVRVGDCAVALEAPCDRPPRVVDATLAWRELRGETAHGEGTPLLVRWRDGGSPALELRSVRGAAACRLAWRARRLHVLLHLDAAALHPRWSFGGGRTVSTAAPTWAPGQQLTLTLALRTLAEGWDAPPALAARLPHGAEAALVITDHCDFDTTERLRAFALGDGRHRGWLGRGLRLTKGVFAVRSAPRGRPPAPTLEDEPYRALVHRLHDDGSEIAPHGVNESGDVPPTVFHGALAALARDFAPRTWIDHGLTLSYCYTMGGAEHPEYALLDRLRAHGFSTLWSYHDAPVDAAASLNALAPPSGDLRVRASRLAAHLARGRPLVAAHYARSALRARLSGPVGDAVGRSLSALRSAYMAGRGESAGARARQAARAVGTALGALARGRRAGPGGEDAHADPHRPAELLAMAPLVYPERGAPLAQARADDLLLFATTEVLHTRDAYTPGALARLVRERGVHVGHCYLLNHLPYIAGILAGDAPVALGDEWAAFVDALADAVADGRLWNPAMADLAEWMRQLQLVTTLPGAGDSVVVRNPLPQAVRGFTLLLPRSVAPADVAWGGAPPAGWRAWPDWLAVWGELAPESRTVVRWG